ncbi:MAG: hypothetical protein KAI63_02855, partial [Planctomycetes bacterium]|nr:hypothetical protein [Planctomycetota bacterium]
GTTYFIGIVDNDRPLDILRGLEQTAMSSHSAGALVIPVFRVDERFCGRGDRVTIVESDQTTNPGEEKTINYAANVGGNNPNDPNNLVAFTDNVTREYSADGITRLLKFPSDELPSYLPADLYVGGECPTVDGSASGSGLVGMIDEIKFFRSRKGDFKLGQALTADGNETTINFNGVAGLTGTGGVVKVGDEFIGYAGRDTDQSEITDCVRGYLDSPVSVNDSNQRAFHLSFLPVTSLREAVSANANNIPLKTSPGRQGGYILVDDEVIGFTRGQGGNIIMPYDKKGVGIFRGSFGTGRISHQQNALAFAIPFRYWDLYKARAFDNEMAYFKASRAVTNALWGWIKWKRKVTRPGVRLKILARVDGVPDWSSPPMNRPGGIFQFTASQGVNFLNVKGDRIEILVFFEYLSGAFSGHAWKESPVLQTLRVGYRKPNQINVHQEE